MQFLKLTYTALFVLKNQKINYHNDINIQILVKRSHSGDLLLWVVVRRCALSATELLSQSLPNSACSISRVRRQEIVNFMTPPSQKEIILG